jgi:hypothetical protein
MAEGTRGQAAGGNNSKAAARGQRGAEQRQPDAGPEEARSREICEQYRRFLYQLL